MSFLLNPFVFGGLGDMEHIATVTVGAGGAASMEFTSIPATFKHLQVRVVSRTAWTATSYPTLIRLNNDSVSSNYASHLLTGNGASATASASTTLSGIGGPDAAGANATAGIFGIGVIDILDYANTSKNTTVRWVGGQDRNGAGTVAIGSGVWLNTAAVNRFTILCQTGNNQAQHSTAALYGVRG